MPATLPRAAQAAAVAPVHVRPAPLRPPPDTAALGTADSRAGASALVIGGLAGALVPVLHPGHGPGYYAHPLTAAAHVLLFVAVLVTSLGLPALVGPDARWGARAGGAALFLGLWCLDGSHGLVDGAVLPALAAADPAVARLLAAGHASQDLLAGGPLGTITAVGVPLFIGGSLLLGASLVRARRLSRAAGWAVALGWVLMPPSFILPALRAPGVALPYLALAAAGGALLARRRGDRAGAPR